jgi:lipopolysaccharide export system protein LptA
MAIVKPILLLLLLLPSQLWALDDDGDQPIEVEADSLEVREEDNISIYQGNVYLVQGSLEIRSDRLVIHFNDANELQLMEMTGTPAKFRQLDDDQQEMLGQANQIDYTESMSLLELRGTARFSHGGDIIESDLIRIDTESNGIQAGSSESDQRVKMLIQPKQDTNSAE